MARRLLTTVLLLAVSVGDAWAAFNPALVGGVPSLAALQSLPAATYQYVFRQDLGQIYSWSGTNCGAPDNVTQVQPNVGTGCWLMPGLNLVAIDNGQVGSGTMLAVGNPTNGGYEPNSTVPTEVIISATGAKNGLVGQVINTVPYATTPFLAVGTTGYGQVPSGTTSVAFGLYGLAEIKNTLGEIVGGEVTARNFGGSNANTGVPPPTGSPSSFLVADGFHITCGSQAVGEKDCSTGLYVSNESSGSSSTDPSFANGIVVNAYRNFGIYVEPGYPTGTQTSAELDNNGNGVNLQLKTTGSLTAGNAVLTVNKADGTVEAAIRQNGDADFNNVLLGATAGIYFGSQIAISGAPNIVTFGADAGLTSVVVGNGTAAVVLSTPFTGTTCTNNGFMTIKDSTNTSRKVMICS